MIQITQADREAAASVAVLTEMRDLIHAGKADHHAEPFARHRIAAAQAERAAVVEWLRGGFCWMRLHPEDQACARHIADAIEAGEHHA